MNDKNGIRFLGPDDLRFHCLGPMTKKGDRRQASPFGHSVPPAKGRSGVIRAQYNNQTEHVN